MWGVHLECCSTGLSAKCRDVVCVSGGGGDCLGAAALAYVSYRLFATGRDPMGIRTNSCDAARQHNSFGFADEFANPFLIFRFIFESADWGGY